MFIDKKPLGLKIVIALSIINALATVIHFFLMGQGIIKTPGLIENLWITAVTVILTGVLPSVCGVYGLYYKRLWGLSFFIFGSGAYMSLAIFVLMTNFTVSGFGIMGFISIYLILYSLLAVLYAWAFRHHLREF